MVLSMPVGTAAGFSESLMYHIQNTAKTPATAVSALEYPNLAGYVLLALEYPSLAGYVLLIFFLGSYHRRGIPNADGPVQSFLVISLLGQLSLTFLWADYSANHSTEVLNLAIMAALNVGLVPIIVVFVYECLTELVVGESHYDIFCADLKYYLTSPLHTCVISAKKLQGWLMMSKTQLVWEPRLRIAPLIRKARVSAERRSLKRCEEESQVWEKAGWTAF